MDIEIAAVKSISSSFSARLGLILFSAVESGRHRGETEAEALPTADSSAPYLSGGRVGAGEGGEPANRRSALYRIG